MINQKESKQVRIGSSLLKLLSADTRIKKKTIFNYQTIIENNAKIKYNRKIKDMGNATTIMDHYPRNR